MFHAIRHCQYYEPYTANEVIETEYHSVKLNVKESEMIDIRKVYSYRKEVYKCDQLKT